MLLSRSNLFFRSGLSVGVGFHSGPGQSPESLFSQPLCSTHCSAVAGCCECLDPLPPQHSLGGPEPIPGMQAGSLTLAFLCGPRGGQHVARVAEAGVGTHLVDAAPSSCAGVPQTLVVV